MKRTILPAIVAGLATAAASLAAARLTAHESLTRPIIVSGQRELDARLASA